jgi:hypothetical protein
MPVVVAGEIVPAHGIAERAVDAAVGRERIGVARDEVMTARRDQRAVRDDLISFERDARRRLAPGN